MKNIEIQKPWCGWSSLTLRNKEKEFTGSLSYIQDVPKLFLQGLINYYKDGTYPAFHIDEEGTEFIFIPGDMYCHIIDDEIKTHEFTNININDFAKEVLDAFSKDIDDWSTWALTMNDDEFNESKNNNLKMMKELKNLINKDEE